MTKGKDFELIVKDICEKLSSIEMSNAEILTNVKMPGADGARHEIDVLYSFEELGLLYQVGIECKNWKSPIKIGSLRDFSYKLDQIGGINGIFISADSGYQSGAKIVADYNGIRLVKYYEFEYYIKSNYTKYLNPDFGMIGDPFWMLINTEGNTSLEQNCIKDNVNNLFFSKKQADDYKDSNYYNDNNIKVVGVSQYHLKELEGLFLNDNVRFYMVDEFTDKVSLDEPDFDLYIR